MGRTIRDLIGEPFGRLSVLSDSGLRASNGGVIWRCLCSCSNIINVAAGDLTKGTTKSCGCLQKELVRERAIELGKSRTTHGASYTPEYRVWNGMIQRCNNTNEYSYKNYGGRGITVCDRWLHSFENFYADMGSRPSDNHTIERRVNDGNYESNNCYWATKIEQANNRRSNHFVTYKGIKYTITELARCVNMDYATLYRRIVAMEWSVEDAVAGHRS